MRCLVGLLLLTFTTPAILAQNKPQPALKGINAAIGEMLHTRQQPPAPAAKRSVTLADAVAIFLQHNLQLVAGRFDVETADAEKLTARLRPNPEFSFNTEQLPLDFSGPFFMNRKLLTASRRPLSLAGSDASASIPPTPMPSLLRQSFKRPSGS